jgi:hypothetical protein
VQRGGEGDDLGHRQVGQQPARLEHGADRAGPDGVGRGQAVELDLAGVGLGQPEQHLDGGRLAGPVRAEQRDDLAAVDREVEGVDGGDSAEPLAEAGQGHRGRGLRGSRVHAYEGGAGDGPRGRPRVTPDP